MGSEMCIRDSSRARPQEPKKPGNAKTRSPPTQANHDMSRICESKDSANRGDPNNRWPRSARLTKVGRRCRACGALQFQNPPTNACVATSVFETPSVLRESLPSYSAKPGAFYAPRALRWTTPPRGRTDPFQGPKIKPMFHRFSMLFQDDLGVENGGQNEVKIVLKSNLSAFQDALGARLPLEAILASILGSCLDPPNT